MFNQSFMHGISGLCIILIVNQVIHLIFIFFQVIELITVQQMNHQLISFGYCCSHNLQPAEPIMVNLISGKLCIYHIIDFFGCIINLRKHAFTFQQLWNRKSKIIHYCRNNINMGCHCIFHAPTCTPLDD